MVRFVVWIVAGLIAWGPAGAQTPLRGGDAVLAPPSLPSVLPGGLAIPGLGGGSPSEVLQRILDAAGGRAPAAPPPAVLVPPMVMPSQPLSTGVPVPRTDPADPLSGTEAFFAWAPQTNPLPNRPCKYSIP